MRTSGILEQDRECCGRSAWQRVKGSFALDSVYQEEEDEDEREEEEALERVTGVSWS